MDIRQIEYIIAIEQEQSISKAAEKLFLTIRVSKDTLTFIDFCLYLENLTRIF